MPGQERRVAESLARLAADGVQTGHIADAAVLAWRDVDGTMTRIVGRHGMLALYKRTLVLTSSAHPCLTPVRDGALSPGEFTSLHAVLSQQTGAGAAAAAGALFGTFADLISSLIGPPLSARLLRAVWEKHSSGAAAQESQL